MRADGSQGVRPRDVPGYEAAVASGTVRPVPAAPPALLPGPSAARVFNRFLLSAAAIVAAVLVVVEVSSRSELGSTATSLICLAAGLLGFAAIIVLLGRVGDRKLEELAHGYTTLQVEFGGFWVGEGRRWPRFGHRPPWDYSGLWVLDGSTGAVISEPVAGADPPGLYASPNRPGALELWTGAVWSGNYREP